MRIQGKTTYSQSPAPYPEPIQPLTRVAVALCQGRWEARVCPRLGVSQTVASPQGGVQLPWMVHVVASGLVSRCYSPESKRCPLYSSQHSPFQTRDHSPSPPWGPGGGLEWRPLGPRRGPRGGRIPGYPPLSLTASLVPTPCPLIT